MPNPTGGTATNPVGVSCSGVSACTAVGQYRNSSGVRVPFAETWSGSSWAVQSVPNPSGSKKVEVRGVSCTAVTACTMVGSDETSASSGVPFAERWSGTEWTVQSVGAPVGAKASYLQGVSCTSSSACTAVGVFQNSSSQYATLAEAWNGSEWQIQSTPNGEKGEGHLSGGVSCSSLMSCAAVGNAGKAFSEVYG
jgi:hypothetical protein